MTPRDRFIGLGRSKKRCQGVYHFNLTRPAEPLGSGSDLTPKPMAPQLLFDLSAHDLDKVLYDSGHIESYNPHRGAMRLLDAIVWEDINDVTHAIGFKDVRDDEFWVPGHIPGRPIFPGVLMIEAAAQFASYITMRKFEGEHKFEFIGFAGVDNVKFRGQVVPGDRLILMLDGFSMKPRRSICNAQGVVNGNLVFEATITGMPM